ncbi:MAG: nicotinamide-nucleotide amidohydrolase family protein [Rhodocyclaceae bacterium]|nr:nicotinamide-nucleotide amidohydrolase family protein [Rhodocyclaceae bacterium]
MDTALADLSLRVGRALRQAQLTLASAESCTGGWVAQVVTHSAGSSDWFERGFVTYSNSAKIEQLGVAASLLDRYGAVSMEVAGAMAAGALAHSRAAVALAITGIAGPSGGSPDKPVGTVCFSWCFLGETPATDRRQFDGDRESVRYQSVLFALEELLVRVAARSMPFVQ